MSTKHFRARLSLVTWLAGLPGIIVVTWLVLPGFLAGRPLPVPMWAVQLVSAAQSAGLLAIAVAVGAFLAHKVSLAAPTFSAIVGGKGAFNALRPQLLPGAIGGIIGAAIIWGISLTAPEALRQVESKFPMPALARLLYGGITEELLIRWGLMTLIVWILWRIVQRGIGAPSVALVYLAIVASAVAFGAGHLPAASAMIGEVTPRVALHIVAGNASFGLIAGWLYWRFGLESAILAHGIAHSLLIVLA